MIHLSRLLVRWLRDFSPSPPEWYETPSPAGRGFVFCDYLVISLDPCEVPVTTAALTAINIELKAT